MTDIDASDVQIVAKPRLSLAAYLCHQK